MGSARLGGKEEIQELKWSCSQMGMPSGKNPRLPSPEMKALVLSTQLTICGTLANSPNSKFSIKMKS